MRLSLASKSGVNAAARSRRRSRELASCSQENKEAIEAWDKAAQLGDIKKDLNRLEYDRFEEVKAKIEQLRGQNAKVTEADRPRQAG